MTSNIRLDFAGNSDDDADPGILKRFSFTNFADNSSSCRLILMKFIQEWDVSLALND